MKAVSLFCACLLAGCATRPPSDTMSNTSGHAAPAPIPNFHVVVPDKLYRGGQPGIDNELDWQFLVHHKVRTVVKLNSQVGGDRNVEQEKAAAAKLKIRLVEAYMAPEDFPENLNPFAMPERASLITALEAIEGQAEGAVFVHCSHGSDRTGLVVALYRMRQQNYCKDKAYAEMKSYGHSVWLPGVRSVLDDDGFAEKANCLH